MNSFEQQPHDYSEVNAHLRQLIINNVVSVQAENDQHQTFFRQMQSDAVEFAETMNSLPGVWTDSATDVVQIKSGTIFSDPQYRYDTYPLWIIREKTRYGGSSLDHRLSKYAHENNIIDIIVILKTGKLAVADYFGTRENGLEYSPNRVVPADRFVDRKPFDAGDATHRLRTEWVRDLEKAARKYARKTR